MQILGSGFTKLTVMRHGNKLHADIHFITFHYYLLFESAGWMNSVALVLVLFLTLLFFLVCINLTNSVYTF